jgi:hypothetical protein
MRGDQVRIFAWYTAQLVMGASLHDVAPVQNDNLVAIADRAETVCHDQARATAAS